MIHSWNKTFSDMAYAISLRSKDPNTQVGAIIVDGSNKILSVGYNGMPRGDDTFPWTSPEKYDYVIHAEENAILNSSSILELENGTLYCTHFPCVKCARLLAQVKIKKVFYVNETHHRTEEAELILKKLKIEVEKI